MPQELINLIAAIFFGAAGWWLRTSWESHRQLEAKVAGIEVLVAGQYIKREEVTMILNRMDHKLDTISVKLDGKADKAR